MAMTDSGRSVQHSHITRGARLDGRYLMEEPVGDGGRAPLWRALDEVLSRRVAVRILPTGSPEATSTTAAVLAAARVASGVGDPRLARVLDARSGGEVGYVISEWVDGEPLTDLLRHGPLPATTAGYLIAEAASAAAAAHAHGVPHLRLHPGNVLRTPAGGVRVTGLGVSAALAGTQADDPAAADAEGLGRLLYAALTARWPDGPAFGLEEAPTAGGRPRSPRQIRAGVPTLLDSVTRRAMGECIGREEPLRSPAEVAAALGDIPRPADLGPQSTAESTVAMQSPFVQSPFADRPAGTSAADTTVVTRPPVSGGHTRPGVPRADRHPTVAFRFGRSAGNGASAAPSRVGGALRGLTAVILLGALGVLAAQVVSAVREDPGQSPQPPGATGTATPPAPDDAGPQVVEVAAVSDFDPPPGDGEEHSAEVDNAVDGDPATAWTTSTYFGDPVLGGIKDGVGLLLDLGAVRDVESVDVSLVGEGTDVELRAARRRGAAADDYRVVSDAAGAGGQATLTPDEPFRARWVLLWLTRLPPDEAGDYRGGVSEVEVRG
jgi:putative peptidoglycan lipid II flippase